MSKLTDEQIASICEAMKQDPISSAKSMVNSVLLALQDFGYSGATERQLGRVEDIFRCLSTGCG